MFSQTPDPDVPIDLLTDLLAYWKMEEGGLAETRQDSTASNLDLTSGATTAASGGIIGSAALFFYPDSNLTNASASFNAAGLSVSISTWVLSPSFSATASDMPLISKTDGLSGYQIRFDGLNKAITFGVGDGGTMSFYPHPEIIGDSVWYHIVAVFTFGSGLLEIYVNNVKSSHAVTEVMANSVQAFVVGEWQSIVFDGRVDETGVWIGRALTESEVDYLWNSGAGITYPF